MDDRMEENAANVSNCKMSWREFHTLKLQGEAPGEHFKLFLGGGLKVSSLCMQPLRGC